MIAIYKREMRAYFTTPIAYVLTAVFSAVAGILFCICTLQMQTSDSSAYFQFLMYVYIVIIALLTMKSFSEEKRARTEQLLLTSPVSLTGMVMAKFLAAFTLFLGTLVLTVPFFAVLSMYSDPNWAKIIGCTVGIILIGSCFIAVGLFMSSLTENQLAAAVGTIAVLCGLVMTSVLNSVIDFYPVRAVLSWISIYSRFANFTYGIFDIPAAVYYISVSAVFIFLTVRVYEKRRYA